MRWKIIVNVLALLAIALLAAAQEGAYERILFPVYASASLPRPGAFGSQWVTEASVRNESSTAVDLFQVRCIYFCTCLGGTCAPGKPLQPGMRTSSLAFNDDDPRQPGIFVYVPRAAARGLSMNLRVRDLSRSAGSFGTEIPVVRDDDQLEGTSRLLDIPMDARFRQHLRIYGISSTTGASDVRVRVYDLDGISPLFEKTVHIVPPQRRALLQPVDDPDVAWPGYAEIGNLRDVLAAAAVPERVRIEIESLVPGLRYWAFVSVTNNDTQQITTVTPQ